MSLIIYNIQYIHIYQPTDHIHTSSLNVALIIDLLVEINILVVELVDFVVVMHGRVFIVLRIRLFRVTRIIFIYKNVDSRPLFSIFLVIGPFWKAVLTIWNVIVKEFIVTVALNVRFIILSSLLIARLEKCHSPKINQIL